MPIYEFYCKKCNKIQEKLLKIEQLNSPQFCEYCGNILEFKFPIISNPVFKGSGFYETDYKKGTKND